MQADLLYAGSLNAGSLAVYSEIKATAPLCVVCFLLQSHVTQVAWQPVHNVCSECACL